MILLKKPVYVDIMIIDPYDSRWFNFNFVRKYDHIFNAYPAFIFKQSVDRMIDDIAEK